MSINDNAHRVEAFLSCACRGCAQILGFRSAGRLNFVGWRLKFDSSECKFVYVKLLASGFRCGSQFFLFNLSTLLVA
jgi:hypothetical protein